MQDLSIHPFFRSKHSSTEESKHSRKHYTSPQLEQYQKITEKYSNYLNTLDNKIDIICQKQKQRNCFKEQKLRTIKNQLLKKKNDLQKELTQKLDPIKTDNGKLYLEIAELNKLESSYLEILSALEKSVKEKEEEIRRLKNTLKQQKTVIKENIKGEIVKSTSSSRLQLPKLANMSDSSVLSHKSSVSYASKTRQSFLNKLQQSWGSKIKDSIDLEEDKLIVLKLLCIFSRRQPTECQHTNMQVIESIERDVRMKTEQLEEIKELNQKEELTSQ